jgi:hypothetical protein
MRVGETQGYFFQEVSATDISAKPHGRPGFPLRWHMAQCYQGVTISWNSPRASTRDNGSGFRLGRRALMGARRKEMNSLITALAVAGLSIVFCNGQLTTDHGRPAPAGHNANNIGHFCVSGVKIPPFPPN